MKKIWRPSVTLAAVIEPHGRFLLVEDHLAGRNFPLAVPSEADG